jgi:hypothetical protein
MMTGSVKKNDNDRARPVVSVTLGILRRNIYVCAQLFEVKDTPRQYKICSLTNYFLYKEQLLEL